MPAQRSRPEAVDYRGPGEANETAARLRTACSVSKNDGKYIEGAETISGFVAELQPHYNVRDSKWKNKVTGAYESVLR